MELLAEIQEAHLWEREHEREAIKVNGQKRESLLNTVHVTHNLRKMAVTDAQFYMHVDIAKNKWAR